MSKRKEGGTRLTVLVWNVWFKSQLTPKKTSALLGQLKNHIDQYKPDVIGLHEVLTNRATNQSSVIKFLKKEGYFVDSLPGSPIRKHWMIGNAVAYKQKPTAHGNHKLGPDTSAKWRGHNGYHVSLLHAVVKTGNGKPVNFVLNYLAHIVPYNWHTHLLHLKEFQKFIAQEKFNQRTIVVGDFNEFRWMLPLWNRRFHRRTGNWRRPTWRLHGRPHYWPLQANYDNVCWDKDGSVELEHFAVLQRAPSDHAPLVATFSIN